MDNVIVGVGEADSSGSLAARGQVGGVNIGEISYDHISTYINKSLPDLAANLKVRRWRVGG